MRRWLVDIRFCPSGCVHEVEAETAEEAEERVWDMIDNQTLAPTVEQKAEMMDCLLENVEEVECVGEAGDFLPDAGTGDVDIRRTVR